MNSTSRRGQQLAEAAAQFLGVRFKLFGRDPSEGLDCVGLLACSLRAIGCQPIVPKGYRLRNSDVTPWTDCAAKSGFVPTNGPIQPGDVLFLEVGPGQNHIVIVETTISAIHAHAGLRRVVRQPVATFRKKVAHWRLR